jgi:hypothetical protein
MMAAVMVMAGHASLLERLYGGHLSGRRGGLELVGELVELVGPGGIALALGVLRRQL